MIVYDPFWKTIKEKNISTYYIIHTCKINSNTITRIRKGKALTTLTINDICRALNCKVEDVMQYIPSEDDQKL